MHFRKQGSLLRWFHTYSGRDQASKKQTESLSTSKSPQWCQNDLILCRAMQLLLDPHQGLCSHRCSIVQTHPERLQILRGPTARTSHGCVHKSLKTIRVQTIDGFSSHRQTIHPNHWCCHRDCRHPWRTRGNSHPSWSRRKILHYLICLQTIKGSWKELLAIFT